MMPHFVRVLRTASSERYMIQPRPNQDAAALDLHYLADGSVAGTLFLFENGGIGDRDVPELLRHIDEVLLPYASREDGSLGFTVVRGHVVGSYAPGGVKPAGR